MPEPDEQTYHRAAQTMIGAQGGKLNPRTAATLAAGWERRQDFRAAVQAAYGDGHEAAMGDIRAWVEAGRPIVEVAP